MLHDSPIIHVILIDDDRAAYLLMKALLNKVSSVTYDVHWVQDWAQGLQEMDPSRFDVCLLDYYLGDTDGLAVLAEAARVAPRVPVILLTGTHDRDIDLAAMRGGAADFLVKGETSPAQFERTIRYVVERRRILNQLEDALAERERAEQALRLERDRAEAAVRAKSAFLANMSHEIRTPLNGVLGMTELALGTDLTEEQREYLELVKSSADALLRLIDDILDLSKIEAGRLELERIEFPIRECVSHATRTLEIRARDKGLTLSCRIADDVPAQLVGDPHRLRQILLNLIGNAVKFTDRGSVTVTAECRRAGADVDLILKIQDTGIGISRSQQAAIFDAFSQGDSSTTRRFGGTGLGLTICSRLVSMMGGRIWVESEEGKGSTFLVETRMAVGAPIATVAEAAAPTIPLVRPLRVLVAEDDPTSQILIRRLLERLGHDVELVSNGRVVADRVLQDRFDAVLLDMQMPEMDGYTAAGLIRRMEGPLGRHTHLIALTASAMEGDRERCLAAGMDDYLSKPVNTAALRGALQIAAHAGPGKHQDGC